MKPGPKIFRCKHCSHVWTEEPSIRPDYWGRPHGYVFEARCPQCVKRGPDPECSHCQGGFGKIYNCSRDLDWFKNCYLCGGLYVESIEGDKK